MSEQTDAPEYYRKASKAYNARKTKLPDFTERLSTATDHVKKTWYPDLVLPADWWRDTETLRAAQEYCKTQMKEFVAVWQRMRAMIELCKNYKTGLRKSKEYVDDGYPALINDAPYYKDALKKSTSGGNAEAPDYRDRWLALMLEGYLVSKPFHRRARLFGRIALWWRRREYDSGDIPADPRILEPFVMRTHSFLTSVPTKRTDPSKEGESRKL